MESANNCKFGSSWTTLVELEFHHVMIYRDDTDQTGRLAPFPSDAVNIQSDSRSGFLVWLRDGAPAHAIWCNDKQEFKRVGDGQVLDREVVRAWAALPFPTAEV